jgi:hypothetical protein
MKWLLDFGLFGLLGVGFVVLGAVAHHSNSAAEIGQKARRVFAARQTSATILPFPNGTEHAEEGHRIDKLRPSK